MVKASDEYEARLALAARAKGGDVDAINALCAIWWEIAQQKALALGWPFEESQDVAQEVVLGAMQALTRYQPEADSPDGRAWIAQCTAYQCSMLARKYQTQRRCAARTCSIGALAEEALASAAVAQAHEVLAYKELARTILQYVRGNCPNNEVIFVGLLQGKTPKEIAEHLGQNPNTVRAKIFRARLHLSRHKQGQRVPSTVRASAKGRHRPRSGPELAAKRIA